MSDNFDKVQRVVLHGNLWEHARHLIVTFPHGSSPLRFLKLLRSSVWPTASGTQEKDEPQQVQVSLGFSRRGLEHALVPEHILRLLAMKAPAFSAGAALRSSKRLGATGGNAPRYWDEAFDHMRLDSVLSLHSDSEQALEQKIGLVIEAAKGSGVWVRMPPLAARRLPSPRKELEVRGAQWVHFGYRDGLSRLAIRGISTPEKWAQCNAASRHEPGEFLLGHAQNAVPGIRFEPGPRQSSPVGANPWIAGPGGRVWPKEVRSFFHNGSFGVLHQLDQNVGAFKAFVERESKALGISVDELMGKLCGRYPDGRPMAAPEQRSEADFDYSADANGHGCPFGSHARRMNARGGALAHGGLSRPLIRRGMPYGSPYDGTSDADEQPRGLMGQFFCASIEDQYEHLLGQWAERVPLGSEDTGGARDPLIGSHEAGDGPFVIPRVGSVPAQSMHIETAFTRTRGVAYLFYPSLKALEGIADNALWRPDEEEEA